MHPLLIFSYKFASFSLTDQAGIGTQTLYWLLCLIGIIPFDFQQSIEFLYSLCRSHIRSWLKFLHISPLVGSRKTKWTQASFCSPVWSSHSMLSPRPLWDWWLSHKVEKCKFHQLAGRQSTAFWRHRRCHSSGPLQRWQTWCHVFCPELQESALPFPNENERESSEVILLVLISIDNEIIFAHPQVGLPSSPT